MENSPFIRAVNILHNSIHLCLDGGLQRVYRFYLCPNLDNEENHKFSPSVHTQKIPSVCESLFPQGNQSFYEGKQGRMPNMRNWLPQIPSLWQTKS